MCGITGIIDLKRKPVEASAVKKMTAVLAHRGPNGEGIFTDANIGLGHRRLSIIDLSPAGSQPMRLGDIWIIFNGEIYNYLELRKEIGGEYRTRTDTEVILRAYERWGEKCLEKLNGIFAFAIWDAKNKKIFAARDRLGVKPFYYATHNGRFYLASEIKALLAAGVPAKPNDKIIYDYLVRGYYDHSEDTFFEGIKQLMPGHSLKIYPDRSASGLKIKKYWNLPDRVQNLGRLSDNEVAERFLAILKDATKIQLRSDVPVGLSVSGGLDSSLLMAAVNQAAGGQRNFGLYHFNYAGGGYDPELPHVNLLAEKMKWQKANVVKIAPSDMPNLAAKIIWHEEQPFPGLPTVAWHKLYQYLGRTKTIVTLEGHGGDEMAAGYDYYFGGFLLDILKHHGTARALVELRALEKVRNLQPDQVPSFLNAGLQAFFQGGVSADATPFVCREALNPNFLKSSVAFFAFDAPFDSFLANFQYRELAHTKLPRVLRSVDRESMAFGRELRVPFLDHRLVEFAFSLPLGQRIRAGQQRFFMRNAAKKLLPRKIAETPKRSLPNPQRAWFQKELRPWIAGILSSKSFGSRKYFNQKKVLAEYEKYCREPKPANAFHIWQWLSIELWLRTFFS